MKALIIITIYLITFILGYLILSLVGSVMITERSVYQIVCNSDWLAGYALFIGWWVSIIPCVEVWKKYWKNR